MNTMNPSSDRMFPGVLLASLLALGLSVPVLAGGAGEYGAMVGHSDSGSKKEWEAAGVLGVHHTVVDKRAGGLGFRGYGHNAIRVELGSGFGIQGDGHSGYSITEGNGLHIGAEPWTLHFNANTNDVREDYIEWQPMGSAGVKFQLDTTKVLLAARAGASIGTLGKGGARWAYGAGAYVDGKSFDGAVEVTRINTAKENVDLGNVDLTIPVKNINLGISGQAIVTRKDKHGTLPFAAPRSDESRVEKRGMLVVRGTFR